MEETAVIKSELQYNITLVNKMDQVQRQPIKSFKTEFESLKRGVIDGSHLERWSEDMDSAITLVFEILGEWIQHLEINASTGGGIFGVGITDIASFEDK